jgi:hypothetical protein
MNTFVWVVIVVAVVFILTYNPEKGALNSIIKNEIVDKKYCNDEVYRAQNPRQCDDLHFTGIQFANPDYSFQKNTGAYSIGGAIIGK